jgi:glycosyltransferase involved in cell wall biosynthesis
MGPETDSGVADSVRRLPNVHRLGTRTQAELVPYLANADAAIVPYARTGYTRSLNALKGAELLAAGVPVVATDLPWVREFDGAVAVARTVDEFEARLRSVIERRPEPVPVAGLRPYAWEEKARRQSELVQELYGGSA